MCKYSTNYNEMSGVVESAAVGAMVNESWICGSIGPFATIKLAIAEAKASENGKWKFDKPSGNHIRNAYFVCKEHEACKRKMKVLMMDSTFHIFYKGEHAQVVTFGARKNSKLSWAQEEHLKKALDAGSKPGQVRVSLLKEAAAKLVAQGQDPLDHKQDGGGLDGELAWLN